MSNANVRVKPGHRSELLIDYGNNNVIKSKLKKRDVLDIEAELYECGVNVESLIYDELLISELNDRFYVDGEHYTDSYDAVNAAIAEITNSAAKIMQYMNEAKDDYLSDKIREILKTPLIELSGVRLLKSKSAYDCMPLKGWPEDRIHKQEGRLENAWDYIQRVYSAEEYGELYLYQLKEINIKLYNAINTLSSRHGKKYLPGKPDKIDVELARKEHNPFSSELFKEYLRLDRAKKRRKATL